MTNFADLDDVTFASLAADDRALWNGTAWANVPRRTDAINFMAEFGTVVVPIAAGETNAARTAKVQAAIDTVIAAADNARPELYFPAGVYQLTLGVGHIATAGSRPKNIVIRLHPDAIITKDASVWPTDGFGALNNAAVTFGYIDGIAIIGGQIDGAQNVVKGTISNFVTNAAGDGIRLFSCSRVRNLDTKYRNCSDSYMRVTPLSSDPNPDLHVFCYHDNIDVVNCNQFSTTNSSGQQRGISYHIMVNSRFENMNSNKWAQRYGANASDVAVGATTDATGYAISATTITLASAGVGNIVSGDRVRFGTDLNWYKVLTGDADVSGGGSIVLASGLLVAIPASATAIEIAPRQTTYLYHANNVYKDCLSPVEWDGLSGIVSVFNRYEGATQRVGQIISNNSISGAADFTFSRIYVRDECFGCASGFILKPDVQADALLFPCENVDMELRVEGEMTSDSGYGFDLEGDFVNATFNLIAPKWGRGSPYRYAARGSSALRKNNVKLNADIQADQTGKTSRNFFTVQGSLNSRGRYGCDGIEFNFGNSKCIGMLRGIAITGNSMTAGTASGATTNNAGYAIGTTVITLASAGTGTILQGDVISFDGDDRTYRVKVPDTDVSNGGTITIDAPGLVSAIPTSDTAITVHARIGTAASSTTDATGYAVGTTTIAIEAAGTGVIAAGDAIKIGSDPNIYTVQTGCKDVSAGGFITIDRPGLRVAVPASTTAITVQPRHFLNDFKLTGKLEGGFSAGLIFCDTTQRSSNIDVGDDFQYVGDTSVGLNLAVIDGGRIDGARIESASSPLTLASSCAGIRLGNNRLKANGAPVAPTISQGPTMASATQSGTTITLTITHGTGTDFTVASSANAARMFEAVTSAGVIIPATAVSRSDATTISITTAAAIGAGGTLRLYEGRDGFRDHAYVPYDNSGYASPLRAGSISVT